MTPYNSWCWEQRRAESPIRRITMTPYNSWCWEQRRAESPIRIQPRTAPWVKRFQQTCALKEQKEEERTNTSLAPVALTVRWIVGALVPRVLPWAVFPLGLRPAFDRNHGCCTLRRIILLLPLRPAIACNHGSCTLPHLSLQFSMKGLYAAKTGWKPNKKLAQGSALGKEIPTNLRSERAKGRRTNEHFAVSCCAYSALDSRCTYTQGVTLGCIPFGASPRHCSLHQLQCNTRYSFCLWVYFQSQ